MPKRRPWHPSFKSEDEDPERAVSEKRAQQELGPEWRPSIEPANFVCNGAASLGVDLDDLRSRRRNSNVVRARELLMVLGVERYGLKVNDLAREFRKSPYGMTQTIARAIQKRIDEKQFMADLNKLDRTLAAAKQKTTGAKS